MPRSRGGARPAPRPAAAPPKPAPQQQQTRPASTAAYPPRTQQPQQPPPQQAGQQSQGPGLFGQMASTAAGVAVGSSIGHAIGGFFGGGGQAQAPADQPVAQQEDGQYAMNQSYNPPKVCESQVMNFKSCMDQNEGNLTICGWYLDQLKACQQAASQY